MVGCNFQNCMDSGESRSDIVFKDACNVRTTSNQGSCHLARKPQSNTEIIKVSDNMFARSWMAGADGEIGDKWLEDEARLNNTGRITNGKGTILGLDEVGMQILRNRAFIEDKVEPARVGRQGKIS